MIAPRPRYARGILDTGAFIVLPRTAEPGVLPDEPLITAVTLAELTVGPLVATTPEQREKRLENLQVAEASFKPLPFDAAAARVFGRVSASLRRAGRKRSARSFDAMIAATAIANGLPLYTCNPGDFEGIEGLTVEVVPTPPS